MNDTQIHLLLELAGLIVVPLVGWVLRQMILANTRDQQRAFKEQGQWRSAVDTRLAVLEERTAHTAARVERIPTQTQSGYKRRQPQGEE